MNSSNGGMVSHACFASPKQTISYSPSDSRNASRVVLRLSYWAHNPEPDLNEMGGPMKFIAATFFLSLASCSAFGQDKAAVSAAEAACGPRDRDFSLTAVESRHPTPIADSGKALIYVVQDAPGSTRVGAQGKWLGALKRGTYFSASVDPGEHHLCARTHIGLWSHLSMHELKGKGRRDLLLRTSCGWRSVLRPVCHQPSRRRPGQAAMAPSGG